LLISVSVVLDVSPRVSLPAVPGEQTGHMLTSGQE
jgi:hypothetical protein